MLPLQPGRAGWLELILSFVSVVIFQASATRSLRSVTVCSGLLAYRTIVRERVPRHHAMFFGPGQSSAAYYYAAPNTGMWWNEGGCKSCDGLAFPVNHAFIAAALGLKSKI
jgi:hypothetical protein